MNQLSVSICIPAYNESKNISRLLTALLNQKSEVIHINKIIVVSSASTDDTDAIVETFSQKDNNISLIKESKRNGKATAINKALRHIDDPIVVIQSADTIPAPDAIEQLCKPFLTDEKLGMTGGAPIPTNDPNSFIGYIIHTWWWFHRNIPRFGEIIAFRNILSEVAATTAVDEAFIQAKMVQLGYKVVHIDEAVVYNHGPENVGDLIKQRRRIFNGHARLHRDENIRISNMTRSSLYLLFFQYEIKSLKHFFWLVGGFAIECWSRILGAWDTHVRGINPFTWDTATSTKDFSLALEEVYDDSVS
jgi:biofilm PGA synthesis N-glycosyltransferase PgaC